MTDLPFRWVHRIAGRVFDLDRRTAESDLRRLRRDVMHQYNFLFKEHGGRIMPQLSAVPNLDWATLVVEVNRLYLRASDDAGRTEWHVSLNHILGPWHRLDHILKKIPPSTTHPSNSDHDALRHHLPEIERVLRSGA